LRNQGILRFLYQTTLRKNWPISHIPRPKQRRRLPVILSRQEVAQFFSHVENVKYRLVFMIVYSAGLRVSEITRLQVQALDSAGNVSVSDDKGACFGPVVEQPRPVYAAPSPTPTATATRNPTPRPSFTIWLPAARKEPAVSLRTLAPAPPFPCVQSGASTPTHRVTHGAY